MPFWYNSEKIINIFISQVCGINKGTEKKELYKNKIYQCKVLRVTGFYNRSHDFFFSTLLKSI